MISSDMASGRPESVIVLPGSSWWPLLAAVATGGFFLCVLLKWYGVALMALATTLICLFCWSWANGSRVDAGLIKARADVSLPLHFEQLKGAPGWHGMVFGLIADAAVFSSLIFGAAYLWVVAPGWPPLEWAVVSPWALAVGGVGWLVVAFGNRLLSRHVPRVPGPGVHGPAPQTRATYGLAFILGTLVVLLWVVLGFIGGLPNPTSHAQSAVTTVLLWYAAVHLAVAGLMVGNLYLRMRAGFVSEHRRLEPATVGLFVHYTLGSTLVSLLLASVPLRLI